MQLAKLQNPVRREFHLFTLLSAMRPDALKRAKWAHIDRKRRVLHVPKPKGGERRAFDLPLSREMIRSLCRVSRAGQMYGKNGLTWIFPIEPVRVGGNIRPPTKTKDVRPSYPTIAQSARVEGIVIIEAVIGPDGRVQDAKVLRSIPLLDQAALDAVRQWEFTPTLLNNQPVPVIMTVTVQFTLS
jgi:TonB family protein